MSSFSDQRQSAVVTCLARHLPSLTPRQFGAWWPIDSFAQRFLAATESGRWDNLHPNRSERRRHAAHISSIVRRLSRAGLVETRRQVPSVALGPSRTNLLWFPDALCDEIGVSLSQLSWEEAACRLRNRTDRFQSYLASFRARDDDSWETDRLVRKMENKLENWDLSQLLDRATADLTIVSANRPRHSEYASVISHFPSQPLDCRCLAEYRTVEARARQHGYSLRHHALAELYLRLLNRGRADEELSCLPLRRPHESGTSLSWNSTAADLLERMLPIEYGRGSLAQTRLLLKNWHYLGDRHLLTPAPDVLVTDADGRPCFFLAIGVWCHHALQLFEETCEKIGIGYYLF